jgi:CubicO group peptidase (beta-lactamase class C family)
VLGWSGPNGAITLRQLLSFTSGLDPGNLCTSNALTTLAACVETISQAPTAAPPATRFDYGSTHLHTAARMAEVVTGATWNAVFTQQLRTPLGLPAEVEYFTFPRQAIGTTNPLVAGGLRMSMNEYAKVLRLVFDKGQTPGGPAIASALFDEQGRQPYPGVTIGSSPAASNGFDFKYGLTAWLECTTPATGCQSLSSPGAFGFTPWIDRTNGYYAILGMETTDVQGEVVNWALTLEQQLKPLIVQALAGQ